MKRKVPCPEGVLTHLDGERSPAEAAQLARHLADCCECRRALAELQQVEQFLADEPLPSLPPGFATRVVARSVGTRRRLPPLWWVAFPRAWRVGLAASLAAAACGGIFLGHALAPTPAARPPVAEMVVALDHPVLAALSKAELSAVDRP
jgi:anti-sigma factor RsiW